MLMAIMDTAHMPKHSLQQRIERIVSDAMIDPDLDIRGRWEKVADDGIATDAIAICGTMPDATLDDVPLDQAIDYAGEDADATWQLSPILDVEIERLGLRHALEIDYAVIPMVRRMMDVGMLIDRSHFTALEGIFDEYQQTITSSIQDIAGPDFSPSSPDQVASLLFERLGLSSGRKTKGGTRPTTDDKALEALKYSHPVVPLLLEYREVAKLRSTYCILPLFADNGDRIHAYLSLARVPSGRLASSDPNLLAIPTRTELGKEIRRGFVAGPGKVLASADLNQIEMRCMAHISQDERMLQAFWSGEDIHRQTASFMFKCSLDAVTDAQRHHGKQVAFGIVNGITASGYVDQMYLRGAWKFDERDYHTHLTDAQRMIDSYLTIAYPGVRAMFEATWSEGRQHGYVRDSLSGRIWRLPGLRSSIDRVKAEAERQATNFKIQTMAQTVLKLRMAQLWDYLSAEEGIDCLLQIHDELLFEDADPDAHKDDILAVLGSGDELSVPVTAKWHQGQTWADLK
jgi:DNA polymerase I